jgi:hypothetical protein
MEVRAITELPEALARLRAAHGLDFARTRRVLGLLGAGGTHDVSDLVARTGVGRRRVEEVLGALSDWLEPDGRAWRLAPAHADSWRAAVGSGGPGAGRPGAGGPGGFGPPDLSSPGLARLLARMREAAAGLPPPLADLDHVAVTPETAVRRAYALVASYDLAGREVLCLGDHDLTSVALGLLDPGIRSSVVDIDDRVLGYVDDLAARWDLPIRTHFADLRLELPPSLREAADLVFTDPPYTPAGIELFLARAIEALGRDRAGRVLFCYSHADRQLARGLQVQQVVSRLQLVVEALLPEFNAFDGAESIGARSALWVCQPAANAWAVAERAVRPSAIYTRGRQAEETGAAGVPAELASLLRTQPPAGRGGSVRPGATIEADLTGRHPSYAYRLLMRTLPAARVVLTVDAPPRLDAPAWRLVGAGYRVRVEPGPGPAHLVVAEHRPLADVPPRLWAARWVLDHPQARVPNAWREALVLAARERGGTLTKNDARRQVAAAVEARMIDGRYLVELPGHTLEIVARALVDGA